MNTFIKISTLLFILLLVACQGAKKIKIINAPIEKAFNESQKKWHKLKQNNGDSYQYSIGFYSWSGYSCTTTIDVKNDKIIARKFMEKVRGKNERFGDTEEIVYVETEGDINTHEKGFQALTIDELYLDCGNKSLQVNEVENDLYFTTDKNGLIKSCGYSLKNCSDDCSEGISIEGFKWLN